MIRLYSKIMNTLADFKRCRIIQKTKTIKFTVVVNVGNKVDLTIEALFGMGDANGDYDSH